MGEIFRALGGVLRLSHPDCYQDMLNDQLEIAKQALILKSPTAEVAKSPENKKLLLELEQPKKENGP